MTRTERSVIAQATCPACGPVYLSRCEPRESEAQDIVNGVGDQLGVVPARRWWECAHLGADHVAHQWVTFGPIELRPVRALHVQVTAR